MIITRLLSEHHQFDMVLKLDELRLGKTGFETTFNNEIDTDALLFPYPFFRKASEISGFRYRESPSLRFSGLMGA